MKTIAPLFLLLACLIASKHMNAQSVNSLYHMNGLFQSQQMNPAHSPDVKVFIGLPGLNEINAGFSNSGFALADLLTVRADDSLSFTPDRLIEKLADRNLVTTEFRTNLLSLGFGGERSFWSFSVSDRMHAYLGYPKDLPRLAWEGNGQSLLGERASLDGIGFDLFAFREYALGYNRQFGANLRAGLRVKFLQGHFNIFTRESTLGMHTDTELYTLTFDGGGEVNSSGIAQLVDDPDSFDPLVLLNDFSNRGMAIDLGLSYQLTKKIELSAAALDLGGILWSRDTRNYRAEPFGFTFEGINVNQALEDSTDVFQNVIDSLEQFIVTNENVENYQTPLPSRFNLGARYQLTKGFGAGLLISSLYMKERFHTSVNLSANFRAGKWLEANLNWGYQHRSLANLGMGVSFRGGPVQFYLMSDNVLAVFAPDRVRSGNIMLGLNLTIGRRTES